jgi:hypothetical protein
MNKSCDCCGDRAGTYGPIIDDVVISHCAGVAYPGDSWNHLEKIEVNLCGKCFSDKVLPFLQEICKKKFEYNSCQM